MSIASEGSEPSADIREILYRRQRHGRTPHSITALILGGITLAVWGYIAHDVNSHPDDHLSLAYGAFLAFAITIGVISAGAAFTWMVISEQRRQAADTDRINAFNKEQHIRQTTAAVLAALKEHDRRDRQQRWENFLTSTGTAGPGTPPMVPTKPPGDVIQLRPASGTRDRN